MTKIYLPRTLCLAAALLPVCSASAQTSSAVPSTAALQRRSSSTDDELLRGFATPPASARLRCYWWWLNGHTTKETITRDLTEMQHKGYGGVLLVDANGSNQTGNDNVPAGPEFGSPAWTELYVHALKTADQLGLEVTLNITSGWNLGAPWVKPENASKLLTFSRTTVTSASPSNATLSEPPSKEGFYRQVAVLAYPLHEGVELPGKDTARKPLARLGLKSSSAEGSFSMPDLSGMLMDSDGRPGQPDRDADLTEVQDISTRVDADGTLHWTPPADSKLPWEVLRVGYTASGAKVSTSSGAWQGLAIDYLDPAALDLYWKTSVLPLIEVAKPYKSLKYIASDSWELGGTNWTPAFRAEFRKRRGYDPVPYLPIVAGRILGSGSGDSRDFSTRFLADLRRTVADLVNDHYDHLSALGKPFGLGIQCESGGPHSAPLDGLETFRSASVVQTEYWAYSAEHRSTDEDRFFVKEASSAAHIYGKPLVAAEGMTSIGNQWNESLGLNLKPSFDRGLTEGMNRLVWHEFTSSPPELGLPGQEYFAGTHLNPNVTWWRHAAAFTTYLNRAQFLLQQGQPISDVLYYYGDMVPNFVRLKKDDPAQVLPGYDYDVTSTEALLGRMKVAAGSSNKADLHTPEGIHYRVLALPKYRILPLAALQLAVNYMRSGGAVVGLRPLRPQGIISAADSREFDTLVELWTSCEQSPDHHVAVGSGQLFCDGNSRAALKTLNIAPDFEPAANATDALDYIHRRIPATATQPETDIYFIRNAQATPLQTSVTLRSLGREPELLNAVTGEVTPTLLYSETQSDRTSLPLTLEPYGSVFVLFRHKAGNVVTSLTHDGATLFEATHLDAMTNKLPLGLTVTSEGLQTPEPGTYEVAFANGTTKHLEIKAATPISLPGSWTLSFPPDWGAPPSVQVDALKSWSESADPGVRYFSGTATYRTVIQLTAAQLAATKKGRSTWLDLGEVHEVAAVRINGEVAQTVWKQPWSVRIDGLLHSGANTIEIDVTNLWPNRLIGDVQSATERHYTWTNIRYYKKDSALLPSGLLGPISLKPLYSISFKP
jgi:hypothetical protein